MRSVVAVALVAAAVAVAACGEATTTTVGPADRSTTAAPSTTTSSQVPATTSPTAPSGGVWAGTVTVIDADGPVVCAGGVEESLPPQCGGPTLTGLDWVDVPWAESAGGTTWAGMYVEVELVGGDLALVSVPTEPRVAEEPPDDRLVPPCPEPPGGWLFESGPRTSEAALEEAMGYVDAQPEASAAWVYNLREVPEPDYDDNEPSFEYVLVAAFSRDHARHEAAIREIWDGPLCVVERPWEEQALRRIQRELAETFTDSPPTGLYWPSSYSVDIVRGVVEVGALIVDEPAQEWVDERYGQGVVELQSQLAPVA